MPRWTTSSLIVGILLIACRTPGAEEPPAEVRRYEVGWLQDSFAGVEDALPFVQEAYPSIEGEPKSPSLPLNALALGEAYVSWDHLELVDPVRSNPYWAGEEAVAECAALFERTLGGEAQGDTGIAVTPLGKKSLVVTATRDGHARVGGFLRRLEQTQAPDITVDLALVPPDMLGRRHGSPTSLEQKVLQAGEDGVLLSKRVREGDWAWFLPAKGERVVAGFAVNQSFSEPAKGPYFKYLHDGPYAEVKVWLLPGGKSARVDLRLGRAEPLGKETRRLPDGDIDLPRRLQEQVATTLVVPLDKAVSIATCGLAETAAPPDAGAPKKGPHSFAAYLRVRHAPQRTPEELPGPGILRVGAALDPIPHHALAEAQEPIDLLAEDEPEESVLPEGADLLRLLAGELGERGVDIPMEPFGDRWWFVEAPEDRLRRAGDSVRHLLEKTLPRVTVEVWALRLPLEDALRLAAQTEALDPAQLTERTRAGGAHARLEGSRGVPMSLVTLSARSYVANLEKVSGGSDKRIVMEYEPTVKEIGAGLLLNALVQGTDDPESVQVRVCGELSQRPSAWKHARILANEHRLAGEEEWLSIALPEARSWLFELDTTLPRGEPVVIEVLPDPETPGTCRAIVVRATSRDGDL